MNVYIIILTFFIPFIYSNDKNIYKSNLSDNDIFAQYYPKAKEILKEMSIKDKIAQMFFLRYNYNEVLNHIKTFNFGGYILYAVDFQSHNKNSIKNELEAIQKELKIKLGLSVDEEGGTVNRISLYKQYRDEPFKSPQNYYNEGGIKKVLEIEKEKINLIKELNLNINFAPVADYTANTASYIYKSFPGYGGNSDTHKGMARDTRDLEEFRKNDFKPFIAGINEKVPMIMVSHNIIEKVDSNYPSSLSAKIHKILREELNYSGIIITDDISMGAITEFIKNESIATIAILSGVDIILTSNNTQNYDEVVQDFEKGIIDIEQIDNAVTRILAYKLMYFGDIINYNIVPIKTSNFWTYFIIFFIIFLIGGVAVYYFLLRKPKVSGVSASDLIDKL